MSRNGPVLSHLFFADDMILFGEASERQIRLMLNCLNDFCLASGQKINYHKSNLFCSKAVSGDVASLLSNMSGIPLTTNLGKYLGVPLIHGRLTNDMFEDIVQRVQGKLEGRKTKFLSFVGRQTLVKSVLSAIPIYPMQTTLIPLGVCSKVEKIIRNFFGEIVTKSKHATWSVGKLFRSQRVRVALVYSHYTT